jgi:hypothetical protein
MANFNPSEHLMQIKNSKGSSDYLPVQWRLVWFREQCPDGTIETEVVLLDLDKMTQEEVFVWNNEKRRSEKVIKEAPGVAIFKATVKDGKGGIATGTKMEKAAAFGDFMEKAETGSIGRALAALGYGTQFTGDEFNESHRIVDAPVDHSPNGSVLPTDAQSGYLLPAEIEQIKKDWAEVCSIKEADIPKRWTGFKAYIADGAAVPDTKLTREHKKAIEAYLEPRRKKAS